MSGIVSRFSSKVTKAGTEILREAEQNLSERNNFHAAIHSLWDLCCSSFFGTSQFRPIYFMRQKVVRVNDASSPIFQSTLVELKWWHTETCSMASNDRNMSITRRAYSATRAEADITHRIVAQEACNFRMNSAYSDLHENQFTVPFQLRWGPIDKQSNQKAQLRSHLP